MTMHRQVCLTLNLKANDDLVREYEAYHEPDQVWSEIIDSIREAGIVDMQIYRNGYQLIMVMTVDDSFDPERKARLDQENPKVVEWERLMETFQDSTSDSDAKWQEIRNIFDLGAQSGSKSSGGKNR